MFRWQTPGRSVAVIVSFYDPENVTGFGIGVARVTSPC